MFYVNTITFGALTACINSFSCGYVDRNEGGLGDDMRKQVAWFSKLYPNATIRTQTMSDADCVALVALAKQGVTSDNVGRASNGLAPLPIR